MKLITLFAFGILFFTYTQAQNMNIYQKNLVGIQLDMPMNKAILLAYEAIGYEKPESINADAPLLDAAKLAQLLEVEITGSNYAKYDDSHDRAHYTIRKGDVTITIKAMKTGKGKDLAVHHVTYKMQDNGNAETARNMGQKALKKFGKPSYGQEMDGRHYYGWCQEAQDGSSGCKVNTAFIRISSQEIIMEDLGLAKKYMEMQNKNNAQDAKF